MKKTWVDKTKKKVETKFYSRARKTKISPNMITLFSIIITALGFYFILIDQIISGLVMFAVGGLLDVADGTVAKAQKKVTKLGGLLDRFADRVNDSLMMLAPVFAGFVIWEVGVIALVLVLIGSYLSSLIDTFTTNKSAGNSLSMRAIRTGILMAGGIAHLFFENNAWQYSYYVIIGIAVYSIFERMNYAVRKIK